MIAFSLYLLLILGLITYNGLFGLLKDKTVSQKQFALLFLLKVVAVPVMYLFYLHYYGGIWKFDAGIYYNDAVALNQFGLRFPLEYIKVLLGFQDDSPGSFFYDQCIRHTSNWDNGRIRVFFYNDNRIVIRIHSILHFISFNSYFVHALWSCFASFLGIVFTYKSLRLFFIGKEIWFLCIMCFFPTLWFHTGALLKEGLTLFFLGAILLQLKKTIETPLSWLNLLKLAILLGISFFLKPYILLFGFCCFGLFFVLNNQNQIQHKHVVFIGLFTLGLFLANSLTLFSKEKTLVEIAKTRQRVFEDAAKGGIFLLDKKKFVRLNYDSTLLIKVPGKKTQFRIKYGVSYIFWEHSHQQDTLYCNSNLDSLSSYELVYQIPQSGSNLKYEFSKMPWFKVIVQSLKYSLFYPMFFKAQSKLQYLASLENLLNVIAFLMVLFGFIFSKKSGFLPMVFIFFSLGVCLLVGYTTPNSGAIFRYRSPALVFLMLSALYYADDLWTLLRRIRN